MSLFINSDRIIFSILREFIYLHIYLLTHIKHIENIKFIITIKVNYEKEIFYFITCRLNVLL